MRWLGVVILLYTQGVRGSSPLPPTILNIILVPGLLPLSFPAHVFFGSLNISMFAGHSEHDAVLSYRSQ